MAAVLIGNWWALALRGIAAILFAVIAIFSPEITATALVLLFGIYALFDGILALVAALRAARRHGRSGALLLEGILDILIAIIAFAWPEAALVALIYLIALWAVVTGIALMAAGLALIRLSGEWLLVVSGGSRDRRAFVVARALCAVLRDRPLERGFPHPLPPDLSASPSFHHAI